MNEIFTTERLIVRQYQPGDEESFYSLNGNDDVMRYIRATKTREESDKFLLEVIAQYDSAPMMGRWAVNDKSSGEFIGSFAIIPVPGEEDKTQLGYSMHPDHWGKGYATELTLEGLKYSFEKLKIPVIYALTEIPNTASQNVLLKAGFKDWGRKWEEGKELMVFIFFNNFHQSFP